MCSLWWNNSLYFCWIPIKWEYVNQVMAQHLSVFSPKKLAFYIEIVQNFPNSQASHGKFWRVPEKLPEIFRPFATLQLTPRSRIGSGFLSSVSTDWLDISIGLLWRGVVRRVPGEGSREWLPCLPPAEISGKSRSGAQSSAARRDSLRRVRPQTRHMLAKYSRRSPAHSERGRHLSHSVTT